MPSGPGGRAVDGAGASEAIFKRAIEHENLPVAEVTARGPAGDAQSGSPARSNFSAGKRVARLPPPDRRTALPPRVEHHEPSPDLSPFFYQPDPEKPRFVSAKAEKLIRRGPRSYFLVGSKPDGERVEVRLTSGKLEPDWR